MIFISFGNSIHVYTSVSLVTQSCDVPDIPSIFVFGLLRPIPIDTEMFNQSLHSVTSVLRGVHVPTPEHRYVYQESVFGDLCALGYSYLYP